MPKGTVEFGEWLYVRNQRLLNHENSGIAVPRFCKLTKIPAEYSFGCGMRTSFGNRNEESAGHFKASQFDFKSHIIERECLQKI
jgi:hypothetical protein